MRGGFQTVVFEEVSIMASKVGKCGCGKRRTRSQKFYQTMNPFNKNAAGAPKSRKEIYEELKIESAAWRNQPITCDSCKLR